MRSDMVRHQLFLPKALSRELEAAAARGRSPRSAILAAALRTYLDHAGTSELERACANRLDLISGEIARIERKSHILLESLALFVRYMLTVNAPLAEEDEAARAIGRDRFAAFIARVGQQLATGRMSLAPEDEP